MTTKATCPSHRFGEVGRKHALLTSAFFEAHQPTVLLENPEKKLSNCFFSVQSKVSHLIFRIIVLHDVNDLADVEVEFIHILSLISVARFHLVQNAWRQIVRIRSYKETKTSNQRLIRSQIPRSCLLLRNYGFTFYFITETAFFRTE